MPDSSSLFAPPYLFLMPAVASVSAAAVFTCTGKAWNRFRGWIYRTKEPRRFWWEVSLYYFVGFGFVVCFLLRLLGAFWPARWSLGKWSGHFQRPSHHHRNPKLCPVHRAVCDERAVWGNWPSRTVSAITSSPPPPCYCTFAPGEIRAQNVKTSQRNECNFFSDFSFVSLFALFSQIE